MNLYKVTLRGMKSSIAGDVAYGISYVVADGPTRAYKIVRGFLDEEDLGFDSERVLESVELIAEDERYPDCGTILFVDDVGSR
jgi:hypothetical protein